MDRLHKAFQPLTHPYQLVIVVQRFQSVCWCQNAIGRRHILSVGHEGQFTQYRDMAVENVLVQDLKELRLDFLKLFFGIDVLQGNTLKLEAHL